MVTEVSTSPEWQSSSEFKLLESLSDDGIYAFGHGFHWSVLL